MVEEVAMTCLRMKVTEEVLMAVQVMRKAFPRVQEVVAELTQMMVWEEASK